MLLTIAPTKMILITNHCLKRNPITYTMYIERRCGGLKTTCDRICHSAQVYIYGGMCVVWHDAKCTG